MYWPAHSTYTSLSIFPAFPSVSCCLFLVFQLFLVSCLYMFHLFLFFPHLSVSYSHTHSRRLGVCPFPLLFKFPLHKGLRQFSINVTATRFVFSAIPLSCHYLYPHCTTLSLLSSLWLTPYCSSKSCKIKQATSALSLCVLCKSTVVIIKQEHLKTMACSI